MLDRASSIDLTKARTSVGLIDDNARLPNAGITQWSRTALSRAIVVARL